MNFYTPTYSMPILTVAESFFGIGCMLGLKIQSGKNNVEDPCLRQTISADEFGSSLQQQLNFPTGRLADDFFHPFSSRKKDEPKRLERSYVYVSYESAAGNPVYFDDMKVTVEEHPVIQRDDYYPFGLAFNSWQRSATSKENKYLYNGKEKIDDLDMGWYDYGARMYMADIGRFSTIDPKTEIYNNWSPYLYGANNPIYFIDYNGEGPIHPTTWSRIPSSDVGIVIRQYSPASKSETAYDRGLIASGGVERFTNENPLIQIFNENNSKALPEDDAIAKGEEFVNRDGDELDIGSNILMGNAFAKQIAGETGNYDFKTTTSEDSFTIGTVQDGIISSETQYEKNSNGEYEKVSISRYDTDVNIDYEIITDENGLKYSVQTTTVNVQATTVNLKTNERTSNEYNHKYVSKTQIRE